MKILLDYLQILAIDGGGWKLGADHKNFRFVWIKAVSPLRGILG